MTLLKRKNEFTVDDLKSVPILIYPRHSDKIPIDFFYI